MPSSNPVLRRLAQRNGRPQPYGAAYAPNTDMSAPSGAMMTIDDVVVRTVGLLALTGVSGAAAWALLPDTGAAQVAAFGSSIVGLVLGLVISFTRITNPYLISGYAVLQGIWLGVVSRLFESYYPGIVIQAVIGTFGVFALMAVLYRTKVLRATPRFTRFVIGAVFGVVILSVVNLISSMLGHNLGLIDYNVGTHTVNWLPIVFSLVAIGVGALTFIMDFDQVEQGVRYGLPERDAWYCAFGMLVGLVFLYFQILRLLGYARR